MNKKFLAIHRQFVHLFVSAVTTVLSLSGALALSNLSVPSVVAS
ncbi:MAG: hypothetical protein ACLRU1_04290 [Veillonella parvula]